MIERKDIDEAKQYIYNDYIVAACLFLDTNGGKDIVKKDIAIFEAIKESIQELTGKTDPEILTGYAIAIFGHMCFGLQGTQAGEELQNTIEEQKPTKSKKIIKFVDGLQ
ncbi:MAG: hypothetical protein PUG48_10395 [Clostridia bacterium]|nr:hypothetical protein [Clostridia bacterium]